MSSFNKARVFILYPPRGSLMVDSDTDVAISILNAREWSTRVIRSHAPTTHLGVPTRGMDATHGPPRPDHHERRANAWSTRLRHVSAPELSGTDPR
jgi:hypothetical protein